MTKIFLASKETHPVTGKTSGPIYLCRQWSPLVGLWSHLHPAPLPNGFQTCPPPPLPSPSLSAPTSHLVVDVTICKHSVEVLDTFLSIPIIVVFQALLYCSHIHRCFNDLIVILESRESKRPMSPLQPCSTHRWACRCHSRSLYRHAGLNSSMVSVSHLMGTPR